MPNSSSHSQNAQSVENQSSWTDGLSDSQQELLSTWLDRYLAGIEKGEPFDIEPQLALHPELAGPFQQYMEQLQLLHGAKVELHGDATPFGIGRLEQSSAEEKQLGDYRLIREIGRGGMGIVYEAFQESLGRSVALKLLPMASMFSPQQVERFRNEALMAGQLTHPNIVPVYAVGVEKGIHFFSMPLIDGQSMDQVLQQIQSTQPPSLKGARWVAERLVNGKIGIATAIALFVQAAQALQAAHEVGVVHRDVKPSNLIVDGHGKLWVADFGLARVNSEKPLTRTGELIGTMRYMSPEQAIGKSSVVDYRTDIYSLGVTLYEVLTLQPAIQGEEGPSLLRAIEQQVPTRLRRLREDAPRDLEVVLDKAMAKNRQDRYDSASEFAMDLQRILDGRPILAKPTTMAVRSLKWASRHPTLVASSLAFGSLLLVGSLIANALISREKARAITSVARASKALGKSQHIIDLLGDKYPRQLANFPGTEPIREDMLRETLDFYRDFASDVRDDDSLIESHAIAESRVGELTRMLQSSWDAIPFLESAHRQFLSLWNDRKIDGKLAAEFLRNASLLGLAYDESKRSNEAIELMEQSLERFSRFHWLDEEPFAAKLSRANSLNNLGLFAMHQGRSKLANQSFVQALELLNDALQASPESIQAAQLKGAALSNYASLLAEQDNSKSVKMLEESVSLLERSEGSTNSTPTSQPLGLALNSLSVGLLQLGRAAESHRAVQRAVDIQRLLMAKSPRNRTYKLDLASSLNNLGLALLQNEQPVLAKEAFEESHRWFRELSIRFPEDAECRSGLGSVSDNLADCLAREQNWLESSKLYAEGIAEQSKALDLDPDSTLYRRSLDKHFRNFAGLLRKLGQWQDAISLAERRRSVFPNNADQLQSVLEEICYLLQEMIARNAPISEQEKGGKAALDTIRMGNSIGMKLRADIMKDEPFSVLTRFATMEELTGN